MKTTHSNILSACLLAASLLLTGNSHAVEGGMGRSVSGTSINPYMAVVPPTPGLIFTLADDYYAGDIGGSATVPVGINLALDLNLKVNFTNLEFTYVWNTPPGHWNFASGLAVPLAWLEATANVSVGNRTGQRTEDTFGVFDLAFIPIIACYHISETEHLGFNFTVWAPTGDYDMTSLANLSLNNWTFVPGVSYTKLFPQTDLEFSISGALQFYTENEATDYQTGVMSDIEWLLIKRFKSGWGIGIIGSWIDQLEDDSGPTADKLNGFNGRSFGYGPIVTYAKAGSPFSLNARWIHEFENQKTVEGDVLALSLSYQFSPTRAAPPSTPAK